MDSAHGIYNFSGQFMGVSAKRMERSFEANPTNNSYRNPDNYTFGTDCWIWKFVEVIVFVLNKQKIK